MWCKIQLTESVETDGDGVLVRLRHTITNKNKYFAVPRIYCHIRCLFVADIAVVVVRSPSFTSFNSVFVHVRAPPSTKSFASLLHTFFFIVFDFAILTHQAFCLFHNANCHRQWDELLYRLKRFGNFFIGTTMREQTARIWSKLVVGTFYSFSSSAWASANRQSWSYIFHPKLFSSRIKLFWMRRTTNNGSSRWFKVMFELMLFFLLSTLIDVVCCQSRLATTEEWRCIFALWLCVHCTIFLSVVPVEGASHIRKHLKLLDHRNRIEIEELKI